MPDYNVYDPFSVCFNILKMKYKDYDESLTQKEFLVPSDKINVFINLETVFKHLSMIPDLEKKLVLQRNFKTILSSNIINLVAHYKRFFINNGLDTKVYIYNTDLDSCEFNQFKYNEDFRTYYLVKYNSNPKFVYLTDALKQDILPEVKTICDFIPNVYYLSSNNIEGSLIPYIIYNSDKERKNLIITGELYETQYSLLSNFMVHYIHKGIGVNNIYSSIKEFIIDITRKNKSDIPDELVNIYNNYTFYCSLLSVLGNRERSIDGVSGVGIISLKKYLESGINKKEIQSDTTNPSMISDIFHDECMKEEFINNYYCTCIKDMYEELTDIEKLTILNQKKDRVDNNSLITLNNTKFYNHPLILEALTM